MKKIVNLINSWAQEIVIAVIVGTIIEMIVPNGKNKKYIKTVIGMYLLFVIMYPIINKVTGKSINLNNLDFFKNTKTSTTSLNTEQYISISYENNLKQEINLILKDKGYTADKINLKTSSDFETITEISLNIKKIENKNVNEIKTVEINTSKGKTNNENNLSNEEINDIKDFLSNELNIDKEKIYLLN